MIGFNLIPSSSLRPRDCVWAISLKIEQFAEFPHLLKLLFCWCKNKGHYQLFLIPRVLLLGPKYTRYSTIWPDVDPADPSSPQSRLARVEEVHHQHEAQLASNAVEAQLSVEPCSIHFC